MKTQIFKDYSAFLNREDLEINGVSQEFADQNPNYLTENETNKGCWNCSDCSDCFRCSRCSDCSDCSRCSRCSGCSYCSDCYGCYDCSDCSNCSDCSGCSNCSGCSYCFRCSNLKNANKSDSQILLIPVIPNIHNQILEVVSKPGALNMGSWHTCETTHCRAGWVVVLAGEEGKKLEEETSTLFAAMQIYKASSPIKVPPTRFFDSNEIAMEDMKRCAELELKEESK